MSASGGRAFRRLTALAGEAIVTHRMIADGDRVMVAVSGGKDSFMLMEVLETLRRRAPVHFSLLAATFDPGFPEFGLPVISDYCRARGWEHAVVRLDIPAIIAEKHRESAPCVLCSRLRRGRLYRLAAETGCRKLALGQHLDDAIASLMMSLCRGQGVATMAPRVTPDAPDAPIVIRPLIFAPEELIREAAAGFDHPHAGGCQYESTVSGGDRAYFRQLTDQLAERIPGVRSNLRRSLAHPRLRHLFLAPGANGDDPAPAAGTDAPADC